MSLENALLNGQQWTAEGVGGRALHCHQVLIKID